MFDLKSEHLYSEFLSKLGFTLCYISSNLLSYHSVVLTERANTMGNYKHFTESDYCTDY